MLPFAAHVGERLGTIPALRIACLATIAGNVLIVVTPVVAGLVAGRIVAAASLGLVPVLAPVYARQMGGVRLMGILGASIQLGVASALIVGSVLAGEGIDWRVGFAVSAALGVVALLVLHGVQAEKEPLRRAGPHTSWSPERWAWRRPGCSSWSSRARSCLRYPR